MKKTVALILTLVLTFSCFSLCAVTTATATEITATEITATGNLFANKTIAEWLGGSGNRALRNAKETTVSRYGGYSFISTSAHYQGLRLPFSVQANTKYLLTFSVKSGSVWEAISVLDVGSLTFDADGKNKEAELATDSTIMAELNSNVYSAEVDSSATLADSDEAVWTDVSIEFTPTVDSSTYALYLAWGVTTAYGDAIISDLSLTATVGNPFENKTVADWLGGSGNRALKNAKETTVSRYGGYSFISTSAHYQGIRLPFSVQANTKYSLTFSAKSGSVWEAISVLDVGSLTFDADGKNKEAELATDSTIIAELNSNVYSAEVDSSATLADSDEAVWTDVSIEFTPTADSSTYALYLAWGKSTSCGDAIISDLSLTAEQTVSVDVKGNGIATVTPESASTGDTITFTATPDKGEEFFGWYDGDDLISTDLVYNSIFGAGSNALTAKFSTRNLMNVDLWHTSPVRGDMTISTATEDVEVIKVLNTNYHYYYIDVELKPDTDYRLSFDTKTPLLFENIEIWPAKCEITGKNDGSPILPEGSEYSSSDRIYRLGGTGSGTDALLSTQFGFTERNVWYSNDSIVFTTNNTDTSYQIFIKMNKYIDTSANDNEPAVYFKNVNLFETVEFGVAGNAIRATDSALRYKFSLPNQFVEGFGNAVIKKIGVLAIADEKLQDNELLIGGSYTENGYTPVDAEVTTDNYQYKDGDTENTYFTVALYNIGKIGNKTYYEKYGNNYSVRPYVIYETEDGDSLTYYGDTVSASIFDVMLEIKKQATSEEDMAIVDGMLANEELYNAFIAQQSKDGWYIAESTVSDYDYSMAIVGDIQMTTEYHPDKLHYMYDWIIDNKDSSKIEHAFSLGDLTNNDATAEWATAEEQFKRVQAAGIDHSLIRGNHDWSYTSNITYDEYGNGVVSYDGTMQTYYMLKEIGGVKYMMLTLNLFPTDAELNWAKAACEEYSDYNVILSTHAYMSYEPGADVPFELGNDSTVKWGFDPETRNCGQKIYDKLVSQCSNIVLVLCGHDCMPDDSIGRIDSVREDGSKVIQLMINHQNMESNNGASFNMLAMFYFSNGGKTVQVEYFSTVNGMFFMESNQFEFELDLVN